MVTIYESYEPVLDDGDIVEIGRAYIADGTIVVSEVDGTVSDLKTLLSASEIRSCALGLRRGLASDFDDVLG